MNQVLMKYMFQMVFGFQDIRGTTVNNIKQLIIEWLKKTGTKEDLELVEDERYYELYKIAFLYHLGKIKSTREMKG